MQTHVSKLIYDGYSSVLCSEISSLPTHLSCTAHRNMQILSKFRTKQKQLNGEYTILLPPTRNKYANKLRKFAQSIGLRNEP